MKITLLSISFLFITVITFAQGIRGVIVDAGNQPVPYANIYVPALKTGTTSNIEGKFELKLPSGEWEVLFQYIGYKTFSGKYVVGEGFEDVRIIMQTQSIKIKEIKVLASGEDPAYYVMRHAIALAPYYTNQVSEYDCKLYLKGSGVVHKIPLLFKKQMKKGGVEKDKLYILESLNKIHFELPDKLEQEVIAIRSSGDDKKTNPMQMITTNLYNVSKYGVVSPVGRNALKVYNFQLAGVFEDQGKLINKIKVIPKTKGQGTFEGFINIVEDYWNIHSADLRFSMPMVDVSMRQLYGLVEKNTWMPTSFDFDMNIAVLGLGMKYTYVASFSDYSITLNKNLDHSFHDIINEKEMEEAEILDSLTKANKMVETVKKPVSKNQEKIESILNKENLSNRDMYKLERLMDKEVEQTLPPQPLEIANPVKFDKDAVKTDSGFWATIRPVPLTQIELTTFNKKDSVKNVHDRPEYKDSIRDARQKFKFKDLIKGRTYRYEKDSSRFQSQFTTTGIINTNGLFFNTVDGFHYSLPFSYSLSDTLGRRFSANTTAGYAFARKAVDADVSVYYLYNGLKRSWFRVSGGYKASDFKKSFAIDPMENDIYTLFFEDNFQKFYQNKFANFLWGTEITNGLTSRVGLQFSKRSPLENHSAYKFVDTKKQVFTPNIPEISGLADWQLNESVATTAQLRISYTPRQRYRIRNNMKYPAESKFPTFTLNYEKGFNNLFGSDVNYDYIEIGVTQKLKIGFDSYFDYQFTTGGFINDKKLFAQDFKYFNVNNQPLSFSNQAGRFYLLDYYDAVSSGGFCEGHISFDFDKFLLKRLPLLNRTLIRENLFASYLNTNQKKNYLEIGYGLKNIFLMVDAAVISGFENGKYQNTGIKISIKLK